MNKLLLAIVMLASFPGLAGCGGSPGVQTGSLNIFSRPGFFPDGERIFFAAARGKNYGIYSMDLKGRRLRRICQQRSRLLSPCLSPDGELIACIARADENGRGWLAVVDKDGGNFRYLTRQKGVFDRAPCFAPGNDLLVFQRSSEHAFAQEFWASNLDASEQYPLIDNLLAWEPSQQAFLPTTIDTLYFSQMVRSESEGKSRFDYQLFNLNLGLKQLEKIDFPQPLASLSGLSNLIFSPDGKQAAYLSPANKSLMLTDKKGGRQTTLLKCNAIPSAFSKSGRYLLALQRHKRITLDEMPELTGNPELDNYDIVLFDLQNGLSMQVVTPAWEEL